MTISFPSADQLAPNPALIGRFLHETVRGDIHLAWIIPDGKCGGRWFGEDVEAAASWAVLHNQQGRNLYWTVNTVRTGLHKKPAKPDITYARFVHVDIDAPKDGSLF